MGGKRIGNYSQRELLPWLCTTIDAAAARGVSAHRDIARTKLREALRTENWNTAYILLNLGPRRNKYLASIGQPVSYKYLSRAASFEKYAKPKEDRDD